MKVLGTILILLTFAQPVAAATSADFINNNRGTLNTAKGIFDAMKTSQTFGGAIPIVDKVETTKDSVLKRAVIQIARGAVQQMVNSTINWANTGFQGRPVYLQNPESYFRTLGDGLVGDFINDELGFLCSPFQAQIKLSIARQYKPEYVPQCTLTDIGVNLANFYEDFDEGGWDAWFTMTQEDSNNPYGAYIGASIEVNSRLAEKIDFANRELEINDFFFSTKDCIKQNPTSTSHPDFNTSYAPGACITYGPAKTPGSVIATQINEQLRLGQEQLITATEIDQLLNAVMVGVLQRTVFNQFGLFNPTPYQENPVGIDTPKPEATASCVSNVTNLKIGGTAIWTADIKNLPAGATFSWIGGPNDEIPASGTQGLESLSVTYTKAGAKNAIVRLNIPGTQPQDILCSNSIVVTDVACYANVTSSIIGRIVTWTADPGTFPVSQYEWVGDNLPAGVQGKTSVKSFNMTYQTVGTKTAKVTFHPVTGLPVTVDCNAPVVVTQFEPLAVSCTTANTVTKAGENVRWTATVTGGSGNFTTIQFSGEEENAPGVPGEIGKIWPVASAATLSEVRNALANGLNVPNWTVGPKGWSYPDKDLNNHISTITFSGNGIGSMKIDVDRAYYTVASTPYTATLRVVDANASVAPVTQACTGGITVSP